MQLIRLAALVWTLICSAGFTWAQDGRDGRLIFENSCALCHGGDANGGEHAPEIVSKLPFHGDEQLAALIRDGLSTRGMPGNTQIRGDEMRELIRFLRTLRPRSQRVSVATRVSLKMADGGTLEGAALNHVTGDDIQIRSDDGRIQLLRSEGQGYRTATSEVDWTTYDGRLDGNRYTTLTEINKDTVSRLAPAWIYPIPGTTRLEVTPVVAEGVMYVTFGNNCYALDAGTGREIWRHEREQTKGLIGNAAGGNNRGVTVAGDRVFMVTDHAHIVALNRFTGALIWDTEMADWRQNYNATAAPLIVGDLVVSGTAGGEQGVRGFLAAYDQETGKETWRFWTVPAPGEPGSETWIGSGIEHPGATTWQTGTYDANLGLVYWTTGNPSPDYNGDDRLGDNLYASSVVALDAKTGELKWYYQFTPHNVWDWDAQQPTVLVDMDWEGQPRKLMVQASRNGFFYVLDRTNGALLSAAQFVNQLTWAKGIGADGRPILVPDQVPTTEGTRICPSSHGAANWYSTSFDPATGLYYVQTLENCNIFVKSPSTWAAGRNYMGGSARQADETPNQKILRAIDVKTGKIAWELAQPGPGASRGGTLATASGLLFFCDDTDRFAAVDSATGERLWQFQVNHVFRASPMTYQFDGVQYVAIAAGSNIISFRLVP